MKKLTLIVSAIALLIGFSQCKKEEITPNNNNEGVFITLTAGYGQQDAKTVFNPTNGSFSSFTWSNTTEYIYVGGSKSDGCIGTLTGTGNGESQTITFSGTITPANDETTLYFFYLGNGSHADATTLDFSNQSSGTVTDWHIAIGSAPYSGTSYNNVTLNMAMAIACFDLSGFGSETVTLFGNDVYSTATIDYKNGKITGAAKGNINLGTVSSEKYVALIPSVNTETVLQFDSNSKTGIMRFLRGIKPASYYSNSGEALSVTANELFTVSIDNKKVRFSRGNLQYIGSAATPYWRFATNQYDYLATTTGQNSASETGDRDLFGWGTSGESNKMPYMTSGTATEYGDGENDIFNTNYDWGTKNSTSITNGGGFNNWYTLQSSEWSWLLGPSSNPNPGTNCRTVTNTLSTNARYTMATIEDTYKGLIIFPDTYTHPTEVTVGGTPVYNKSSDYTATITLDDWKKMEMAGAIFLPVTGRRYTFSGSVTTYQDEYKGYYWSSTQDGSEYAKAFLFASNNYSISNQQKRKAGFSVRLVRE